MAYTRKPICGVNGYAGMHTGLILLAAAMAAVISSCSKWDEVNYDAELQPLIHGIKTSAALGYCASIAADYFMDGIVPANAILSSKNENNPSESMLMVVTIDDSYPLPFNSYKGQITIAGVWNGNGGVITALFTDMNMLGSIYLFKGLYTIPITADEHGEIKTLFAEQDVVIGEGSDTLLHLNMSIAWIGLEMERLNTEVPSDPYVAAQQNVWFINVDRNNDRTDMYGDLYTVCGGGQIAKAAGSSAGVIYHALIDAKFSYAACDRNPVSGVGLIQNLQVGTDIDLGHILLQFHDRCDGRADVEIATGKYLSSNFNTVDLNF